MKLKKQLVLLSFIVIAFSTICFADDMKKLYVDIVSFKLFVDNKEKKIDNKILLEDGTTYLPLRELSNLLGCSVEWNEEEREISIISEFNYNIQDMFRFTDEITNMVGYKNSDGEIIVEPKYTANSYEFNEGVAIVELTNNDIAFINETGHELISYNGEYYAAESKEFSEGATVLSVASTDRTHGGRILKYFYVDSCGNRVINNDFEYARNFHDGYACVLKQGFFGPPLPPEVDNTKIYSYINKHGEYVSDEYLEASDFHDGYASVTTLDGKHGTVDREFNFYPDK